MLNNALKLENMFLLKYLQLIKLLATFCKGKLITTAYTVWPEVTKISSAG